MKLLIRLAVAAVVLVIVLGLAITFLVPPAAKKAVEGGSQYAFGVPTALDGLKASIGPGESGLAFDGYRVASPEGFGDTPLLSVRKLGVDVGTRSLFGEPKVLDELVLEGLELNLVQRGLTENNLLPVLQQVRRLTSGKTPSTNGGAGESGPGPRIRIGRVRISGLAASIDVQGIPGLGDISERFELPAYADDWSARTGEDGVTVAEFTGMLMENISDSAVSALDGKVPAPALAALRATLDGGLEGGFGGALDAAEDQARELIDGQVDELEKRAKEKLDGAKDQATELLEGVKEKASGEVEKLEEKAGDEARKALEGVLGGKGKGLLGGGDSF